MGTNLRSISTGVLVLVATVLVGVCGVARGADRPNVLLILVDDLKPVLGCYGEAAAKTPNLRHS